VTSIQVAVFLLGAPGSPLLTMPAKASALAKDPLTPSDATFAALDAAFAAGIV
jgi:hypothetical protein